MIDYDFHMHTTFCDGKNTPEEMVLAAIEKGIKKIGFSGHSYVAFDEESGCMLPAREAEYRKEIARLKNAYADAIEIYCGLERDYYSDNTYTDYDYIIGSVHYVKCGDEYVSVDDNVERLKEGVEKCFGGDYYAYAEEYFKTVSDVVNKTKCDIIGHFDLISKFNEREKLFDESDERYVKAWKKAADALIETGKYFEINTGAISRGYKKVPYPSFEMIEYLKARGAEMILSSDSHSRETIQYDFDKYEALL